MKVSDETVAQVFPFLKHNGRLLRDFNEQAIFRTLPENTTIYSEGDGCGQIAWPSNGISP